MKKILLATSALVALSGAAAAEITISGDARIGLRYDSMLGSNAPVGGWTDVNVLNGHKDKGWNIWSRARVTFTMTGETDSGLSFGAKFRADQANNAANYSGAPVGSVWAEGAYGRLAVGDVYSALGSATGDLAEVGLTGLGFYNEFWYSAAAGNDSHADTGNKGLLYTYTYGDASFYASFEDAYHGTSGDKLKDKVWSLGASYDIDQYSFGIGYSQTPGMIDEASDRTGSPDRFLGHIDHGVVPADNFGKVKTFGLSASGQFDAFTAKAIYVQSKDSVDKLRQYGLSGEYDLDNGFTIAGYYRQNKWSGVNYQGKEEFLGLGGAYDLGGGASVKAGVLRIKDRVTNGGVANKESRTLADFGLDFKF